MYAREKRVLLPEYLEQGWLKEALDKKRGISCRTIYYWISTGRVERELRNVRVQYKRRPSVERNIDRFRGIIA